MRQRGRRVHLCLRRRPGFANGLPPLRWPALLQKVTQVRCYEIADYATYDGVITMRDMMGFGRAARGDSAAVPARIPRPRLGYHPAHPGRWLRRRIDEIRERHELPRARVYDIAALHIESTRAAVRFGSSASSTAGGDRDRAHHPPATTCARTWPDLPTAAAPAASRITGEPSYIVDITQPATRATTTTQPSPPASADVVNAIPPSSQGRRGVRTTLDLPLITGPGLTPEPFRLTGISIRILG